MILVVLTDDDPSAAVKRLFTRTWFVLSPLSALSRMKRDAQRLPKRRDGERMLVQQRSDRSELTARARLSSTSCE